MAQQQKPEPKNGDLWLHDHFGLVEVIKPFGDTVKTHEHICEIVAYRPKRERRILRHELMHPLAFREVVTGSDPIICQGCQKEIPAGKDYFRFDSPKDAFGPEIKGDACNGCLNQLCTVVSTEAKTGKVV